MKRIWVLFFVLVFATSALAEYRIWTNTSGYSLEARYVRMEDGKVVLKKRDGKELKIDPSSLCSEDQEYLKSKDSSITIEDTSASTSVLDQEKPPRLDVNVAMKTNTGEHGYDWVERDVSCVIKIKKVSVQTYSRKLKAELYVIGKAKSHGWYVMLDKKTFHFDFTSTDSIELPGAVASTRYYQTYSGGIEFEGYVAVIKDDQGNQLEIKASSNKFRDSLDRFSKFSRDDVFTKSFEKKGTRSSFHFDDWEW